MSRAPNGPVSLQQTGPERRPGAISPKNMTTDVRLKRLRDLIVEVEQMPPSPERDRVLQEIRERAVDVDTGVTPRAMLPVDPAPPISQPRQFLRRTIAAEREPVLLECAKAYSVASSSSASSQAAAPARSAPIFPSPQKSWLLRDDELLRLEDGPTRFRAAAGHEPTAQHVRSWTSRSVASIHATDEAPPDSGREKLGLLDADGAE